MADQAVRDWAGLNTPAGDPDEFQPAVYLLHDKTRTFESVHKHTEKKQRRQKCKNEKKETEIAK